MRRLMIALTLLAAPLLAGCGFTPLYATGAGGGKAALSGVKLAEVTASDVSTPILTRAFERRTAPAGEPIKYDLFISVREDARSLAVQIDDSVTRYNYRLQASYTLTERSTGKEIKGRAESIASFNVVSSQYSTLYAEQAAREKAARVLVAEVERDILFKFAAAKTNDGLPEPAPAIEWDLEEIEIGTP